MCIEPQVRDALLAEFRAHLDTYGRLREGDSMMLEFSARTPGV
jgi:hypothetical protein